MNPDSLRSLEIELGDLRGRISSLEEALRAQKIPIPARDSFVAAPPLPVAASIELPPDFIAAPETPSQPASTLFAAYGSEREKEVDRELSLENRIGSQWFNRIGIAALLIGMAWFLKLAIDNHWIGPVGRVLIGLIAGVGIISWSERFRAQGAKSFSYSLKAVGSGTLYLSLWAAFELYHLVPSGAAFAAMVAVTAFNGFMAWRQDAELLALYAIAGCLSTPLLVSTGGNHQIVLFSYLLLMDLAVLILVALKPWSRLLFVSFVGTELFFFAWWAEFYSVAQSWKTAFFAASFFLVFALAPRLVRLNVEDRVLSSHWDGLVQIVLPLGNVLISFLTFYLLLDQPGVEWAKPWLAIAMAAFYLLLIRLPQSKFVHKSPVLLSALHLTTAIVLLTIAIPLKAHGRWLTVGWLVEAAALLWVTRRSRSSLLQVLAVGCLGLGLIALLTTNPPAGLIPFINQRFVLYLLAIATSAFAAWTAWQAHSGDEGTLFIPWPHLALGAALATSALILIAVGLEINAFWWQLRWQGDGARLADFQMYAQFTYSAWFMLYGAVLLALGFARASAILRWQALVLLAVSIGKVFLVDISELGEGLRILSFMGLGALLLAVSYVYQKDFLHLRADDGAESHEEPLA